MTHLAQMCGAACGASIIFLAAACGAADRMNNSRMLAEETAAIQTIRVIHTAQVQYFSQYGAYAKSLTQLGPSTSGPPGAQAADLIPADLAGGVKNGYKFSLEAAAQKYSIQARPVTYGKTGNRSFYSDESMILRQNTEDAPATAQSPELK